MKPKKHLLLSLVICATCFANETDDRSARIREAVAKQVREGKTLSADYSPVGLVFQPKRQQDDGDVVLELREAWVRLAAERLADYLGKEVFVSAQVEKLNVSLKNTKGSRNLVAGELMKALTEAGVDTVPLGTSSIALIKAEK
jgi:hypothetical protein